MNGKITMNSAFEHDPKRGRLRSVLETMLFTVVICAIGLLVLGASASPDNLEAPKNLTAILAADVATPPAPSAVDAVPALPPTGNGIIDQVLGAATAKYGWAVSIITWLWVIGMIFKPLFEFAHKVVDATPTDRDNIILAKVEASSAYRMICYALDWVLRVKIGTQKPIPPVPGK